MGFTAQNESSCGMANPVIASDDREDVAETFEATVERCESPCGPRCCLSCLECEFDATNVNCST